jgi:hypothetical protein
MAEGILLGTLVDLELEDGRRVSASALKGCLLAWVPSRKDLIIVRRSQAKSAGRLGAQTRKLHQEFHNAGPSRAIQYDWQEPQSIRPLGRLRSLTYSIPKELRSPEKVKYRWHHAFGDHGERGHGTSTGESSYPTRYMPELCRDSRGNLYIRRMPGNKYYVKDWIFW